MKEFFVNDYNKIRFELFGSFHLIMIILLIIGLALIYNFRSSIRHIDERTKRKISYLIVFIMFINMKIYYISKIIYGSYSWQNDLPLHFCFISGYLFILAILLKNKKMYKLSYFFAFVGPLPAIIWSDLEGAFDVYVFYQFIISHHFFMLSNLFIFYAYDWDFKTVDIRNSFILANIINISVLIFNVLFGTNYIMQKNLPQNIMNLYPFLYRFNYPIIILEITGIIVMFIAYIPIYLRNSEETENNYLQYNGNLL